MQFIENGPDIPNQLLQAHEEGRVIFFCGAGISYPAGLPGFKGLVDKLYELTKTKPSNSEQTFYEQGIFDRTLDLLERRLPGQRLALRRELTLALQPKLRRKGAMDTHKALLHLARNRDGVLRLVTTNFDRIFHAAAKRTRQTFQSYAAPMLPIPKNSRWNGLVFLHGLLPEKPQKDEAGLNNLIVTSGDFGLAYLTEGWAARFVSELFRNYVVCFVGYSINDPVMRYMMDALAAEQMLGEVAPQVWAFGSYAAGQKDQQIREWENKNVTPILYEVNGNSGHSVFHQTLQAWAQSYRDGIQGQEAIVTKYAALLPQQSTQQDDFVSRMLWALSDKTGLPAKLFADFNPAPSLDWLEVFSEPRFICSDLMRFGIHAMDKEDKEPRYSLVSRPAPYDDAPFMQLVGWRNEKSKWDKVMFHLARWLTRHLNDPKLFLWLVKQGGHLHERLSWQIENELERFFALEQNDPTDELGKIRKHAPMAIPIPLMRTLWRLLLSGRVKSGQSSLDLYHWKSRFLQEGLTTSLRLELRGLLTPKILFKKPFPIEEDKSNTEVYISKLVDWDIALVAEHIYSDLCNWKNDKWQAALPSLLGEFQQLLQDSLDLLNELGVADAQHDRHTLRDLPSIKPHWQNRGLRDWVGLIELLRNAWQMIYEKDKSHAARIAENWFDLPYPTFKRLAFYAASQEGCISPEQWVDWLLADSAWWLWIPYTKREVCRLLAEQGRNLQSEAQIRLEKAILDGPLRTMYRDDLEDEEWQRYLARGIWLHLSKMQSSGSVLGASAAERLKEIAETYPAWKLDEYESDEFIFWMSSSGDPDFEERRQIDITPHKKKDLVLWLKEDHVKEKTFFYEDTWQEVCRKHPINSLCALNDLAQENIWPIKRWQKAFWAWQEKERVKRTWRYAAPVVSAMPEYELQELAHPISRWMENASKVTNDHEYIFLKLCSRIIHSTLEIDREDASALSAINHPAGMSTQVLINLVFNKKPNDGDLLPLEIKEIFTKLCDPKKHKYRPGRAILGLHLVSLYRIDNSWTETHLLPLFDWKNFLEARAVWTGFLLSPRPYLPLLKKIKPYFLESAKHYEDLGEERRQFVGFLTYAALEQIDGYNASDFESAFATLPQQGLGEAAQTLVQALESAAERREVYWQNRIRPFWQKIWPKSRELITEDISLFLMELAITARNKFPDALETVNDWLKAPNYPGHIVFLLHQSELCNRFPQQALQLLGRIINNQIYKPQKLQECLEQIKQAEPSLQQNSIYLRLQEYCRI